MEQDSPTDPEPPSGVYETIVDPPRYTEIPALRARGAVIPSQRLQPGPNEAYSEIVAHSTVLQTPMYKPAVPSRSKKPKLKKQHSDPLLPQKVILHKNGKLHAHAKKLHSLSLYEGQTPDLHDDSDIAYSLPEFVHKHSSSFPLRIAVESGMCSSAEEDDNISAGEIYDVHFLKYTTVVHLSTQSSQMYAVPLNSAVQFGLVYNPHDNLQEALKGIMFESVAELLEAKPLPKIIRVTQNYLGGANSSVTANEILLVLKTSKLKVVGHPLLRVYSLTKQTKKALHPQCRGHFTTSPKAVSICLPDILQYLPDPFPLEVVAHSRNGYLPEQLTEHVITLTHSSIETSVIASVPDAALAEGGGAQQFSVSSSGMSTLLDIPLTLDIEVSISRLNAIQQHSLHFATRELYESFEPSKVKACLPKAPSSEAFSIQSQLLKLVSKKNIMEGIELGKPEVYNKSHRISLPSTMLSPQSEESVSADQNAVPIPPLPPRNSHPEKTELDSSLPSDPAEVKGGESAPPTSSCEKQPEDSTGADQQLPDREALNEDVAVPTEKQASNAERLSHALNSSHSLTKPSVITSEESPAKPEVPLRPEIPPRPHKKPMPPVGRPRPEVPKRPPLPLPAEDTENPIYIVPGDLENYQPLSSFTVGTLSVYETVRSTAGEASGSTASQCKARESDGDETSTPSEGKPEITESFSEQVNALTQRTTTLERSNEEMASSVSQLQSEVEKLVQLVKSSARKPQEVKLDAKERLATKSTVSKKEMNQQYLASLTTEEVWLSALISSG